MEIGSTSWDRLISDGAKDFGIHLTHDALKKFSLFANELIAWNKKVNLTAITNPYDIAVKHFIDSVAPSFYIRPETSMIDIGSGGGFPGIPLAIINPSLSTTLIDSSRKKVSFLKHIVRMLALGNVSVYQISADNAAKNNQFAGLFNLVISRALFSIEKLVSIALPLISENGEIIAMKGNKINNDKELNSVTKRLSEWKNEHTKRDFTCCVNMYRLKHIEAERSIFRFQLRS